MKSYASTGLLILLLSGCAGVPEQTFNFEKHALDTIAVANPVYEKALLLRFRNDQLETVDAVSPVPIGKLFAYVAKRNRESAFTENSETQSNVFATNFYTEIRQRLANDSYSVVKANLPNEDELRRDRNQLLKAIPSRAFNGADALLETSGEIGFTAAGRGKPFEPTLWVTIRLTASSGTVLLQDRILFNPPETGARGLLLHPTGDFVFENQEDILESPQTAMALEQATRLVADELVYLLKGPVVDVR